MAAAACAAAAKARQSETPPKKKTGTRDPVKGEAMYRRTQHMTQQKHTARGTLLRARAHQNTFRRRPTIPMRSLVPVAWSMRDRWCGGMVGGGGAAGVPYAPQQVVAVQQRGNEQCRGSRMVRRRQRRVSRPREKRVVRKMDYNIHCNTRLMHFVSQLNISSLHSVKAGSAPRSGTRAAPPLPHGSRSCLFSPLLRMVAVFLLLQGCGGGKCSTERQEKCCLLSAKHFPAVQNNVPPSHKQIAHDSVNGHRIHVAHPAFRTLKELGPAPLLWKPRDSVAVR